MNEQLGNYSGENNTQKGKMGKSDTNYETSDSNDIKQNKTFNFSNSKRKTTSTDNARITKHRKSLTEDQKEN